MNGFIEAIFRAWQTGNWRLRLAVILVFMLAAGAGMLAALQSVHVMSNQFGDRVAAILGGVAATLGFSLAAYSDLQKAKRKEAQIERFEERVREHPETSWRGTLRTKLDNYLERNLSQVRSIYWLTLLVMGCGFAFVAYGLFQASQHPDKLPVSYVASALGVLISFIGGSFLLIYRSVLAQSKDYVTVLERINAVGMAVQVISNIPETNSELKNATTRFSPPPL
jgi:hypothetical protein